MDPNDPRNKLHLNFGFDSCQFVPGERGRAFPTTPSTFPQPIYPNPSSGQKEVWGNTTPSANGYSGQGYFVNAHSPQPPYQTNYQQHLSNLRGPPANQAQTYNDGTQGLVSQFSNQNLGPPSRTASPFVRQPSPACHRPAGISKPQYGNQLTATLPIRSISPAVTTAPTSARDRELEAEEPPERDSSKYSDNVPKRVKVSIGMVASFFKENVQRARERNQRGKEIDELMKSERVSQSRKIQKLQEMRLAEARFLRFLRTKEMPQNFATVKIIGKGAFGEVRLVQRKTDGKIYALKSLIKAEMVKKDQLAHVRSERDILAESDSPWVVKLHTTFQDSTFLYMLMDFLPGGDLMTMLIKYEIFSEDITRFYMAELVCAIEAVHKLGFIHRDIKPDNILLDREGHIKLTDFGLSTGFHKEHDQSYYQQLMATPSKGGAPNNNRISIAFNDQITLTVSNRGALNTWRKNRRQLAFSTVGTPDYIAPEIFSNEGYDYACDWWSVGTIMFECLIGWPPFCAEDARETYKKIINWPQYFHFPEDQPLSKDCEHFVRSLITSSSQRLGHGMANNGAHEIKSHPFFRGVSWDMLRRVSAPFRPKLQSAIDTTNFPIDEIPQHDTSAELRAQTAATLTDEQDAEMSLPFVGYTYKRFDAFRGS